MQEELHGVNVNSFVQSVVTGPASSWPGGATFVQILRATLQEKCQVQLVNAKADMQQVLPGLVNFAVPT